MAPASDIAGRTVGRQAPFVAPIKDIFMEEVHLLQPSTRVKPKTVRRVISCQGVAIQLEFAANLNPEKDSSLSLGMTAKSRFCHLERSEISKRNTAWQGL
jgi:hypothetical protein